MLKLERGSSPSAPLLRLRERERFLEPRLLQAFAAALFLHCAALLLFRVSPFHLSSTFRFPPVEVQSDAALGGTMIDVSLSDADPEGLAPPPPSLLPPLDGGVMAHDFALFPSVLPDLHALQFLEDEVWPAWEESFLVPLALPRIRLTLSGGLFDLSLREIDLSGLEGPGGLDSDPHGAKQAGYRLYVEGTEGIPFWYERTQSSGSEAIDRLTEALLLRLRFVDSEEEEFVGGEVGFEVCHWSRTSP